VSKLDDYLAARQQELSGIQDKLRQGLAGAEGFTSVRPVQFAADIRIRQMIVDELERLAKAVDFTVESPARRKAAS
jgi:hypothetical protein